METTVISGIFGLIRENIFIIIYLFALVQIYLVISIFYMLKKHELVLSDVVDNLLKGFPDAPDKDSTQHRHEKIQTALQFITNKVAFNPEMRQRFYKNAQNINERPFFSRHYKIETHTSVMSTLVQVFPLLGILGTILAIAQTAFKEGSQIDVSSLSNAFVLAMDTTILGISLSIIFMLIESGFYSKTERVIQESHEYRKIMSEIYLSQSES